MSGQHLRSDLPIRARDRSRGSRKRSRSSSGTQGWSLLVPYEPAKSCGDQVCTPRRGRSAWVLIAFQDDRSHRRRGTQFARHGPATVAPPMARRWSGSRSGSSNAVRPVSGRDAVRYDAYAAGRAERRFGCRRRKARPIHVIHMTCPGTHHSSLLASGAARSPSSSGWHSASEDESHWDLRCFSAEVLGRNEAPAHVRSPQNGRSSARSPWSTGARGDI